MCEISDLISKIGKENPTSLFFFVNMKNACPEFFLIFNTEEIKNESFDEILFLFIYA
jgi:hypothetical protein